MSDLEERCLNCNAFKYCCPHGIETDCGFLCGRCLMLPVNAVTSPFNLVTR